MEMLSLGRPLSMLLDVPYATPSSKALALFTANPAPTIEGANDPSFSPNIVLTIDVEGGTELAAPFIRCTSGNITVTLKEL